MICAGGNVNPNLDIHKAEIIATTTPAIEGIQINFEITGHKGYDSIKDETEYNINGADNGKFSNGGTK
ncbi:MAG TPA: hypothetical protein PKV21_05020 [bacterium]|nr:hypothetical protein [bacterium]HOM26851.1 hypothetical protein [bacterium]